MTVETTYNEIHGFIDKEERHPPAKNNEKELLKLYYWLWQKADATQTRVNTAASKEAKEGILANVQAEVGIACPNRGSGIFLWGEDRFAGGDLQVHISKYMKMAMLDVDTKWVGLARETTAVKLLFVQHILNVDKHYSNAAGIDDMHLLYGVDSAIKAWTKPVELRTSDVIGHWLAESPKDSIWTGQQHASEKVSKQLNTYRDKTPAERYYMWALLINYIRGKRNMETEMLRQHIRHHVAQIVEILRPHVAGASAALMRDFLDGWLDNMVEGDTWDWAQEE
jgi:hypothetical protein